LWLLPSTLRFARAILLAAALAQSAVLLHGLFLSSIWVCCPVAGLGPGFWLDALGAATLLLAGLLATPRQQGGQP